jgi:hypothetical protein
MEKHYMKKAWLRVAALGLVSVGLIGSAGWAQAQQPTDGDRSQFAGMARVGGEITAVTGMNITIKTEKGETVQIVTTANTRVMRGRGESSKVTDLKVGDGLMAMGNLDASTGTLHAALVLATDAAQLKAMKENLGKTYIAGKVTAIDTGETSGNPTITVERPDHVSQTIGLDETTSFRRGGRGGQSTGLTPGSTPTPRTDAGEAITLADVKVGDTVRGTGSLKNGVFVPSQLVLVLPGQGGRRHPNGTAATPQ